MPDSVPGGMPARQLPTHAGLIQRARTPAVASSGQRELDAIIVPAARPARNLESVVKLAADMGCQLVLLCSRDARPDAVTALLKKWRFDGARATVTKIRGSYSHNLPRFESTRWIRSGPGWQVRAAREHDLSIKRNIGLLLAHMLGWQRICFIDDDIRDVTVDALTDLAGLLGADSPDGPFRTAGMTVREFPDNSVVCHARRDVKEEQDVFVSGSVLAVDTASSFGFFPDIYNEDWLFFYDDAASRRLATSGFHARQERYDPFEDPQRAARQEFGDVIAEGLYSLLHSGSGWQDAKRDYWVQFLEDRARIIDEIIGRLHRVREDDFRAQMRDSIFAARRTLTNIRPAMCTEYIRRWREDLARWERLLERLPQVASVDEALQYLLLRRWPPDANPPASYKPGEPDRLGFALREGTHRNRSPEPEASEPLTVR